MPGGIFINYRGEDSHSYGALLHLDLSRRFGPESVFLDSASIPPGANFVEQLLSRVRQADVVLAVVGPHWLSAAGPDGRRRLDDPADWIRRELVEAFASGVRVIPVLTDDARMPTEQDLPADLRAFGSCQFRRLRHRDAAADLGRIANDLNNLLPDLAITRVPAVSAPNQLPAAPRHFTGRQDQLSRLVRPRQHPRQTLAISAIDGMAGIGKTALAVVAAYELTASGRYGDGTLFLDLLGYSGRAPIEPFDALEALLRGLGVPGTQIPPGADARGALYRTITAGRQLLIVLDNARDEAQVRPLLPGSPGCMVLITSRRRLSGLDDADHMSLDAIPPNEGIRLLQAIAGRDLGAQQTPYLIVQSCGSLPLAIRIAATRLKTSRTIDAHVLLKQLEDARESGRLQALDDGERSVSAALEVSYQHLNTEQRRAFSLLGLHSGPEFESSAIAALLRTTRWHAASVLDALERVNMLEQTAPGRYRFHDLVRLYAGHRRPEPEVSRAALRRLYGHYGAVAMAAVDLAYPVDSRHGPPPRLSPNIDPDLTDRAAAMAWLDTEQPNMLATVHRAAREGQVGHVSLQATTLRRHLHARAAFADAVALDNAALKVATEQADRPAEIAALNGLGAAHSTLGHYLEAIECHTRALTLARAAGDLAAEFLSVFGLGETYYYGCRYELAAEQVENALIVARDLGNHSYELRALNRLGATHHTQGRYRLATQYHNEALELARAGNDSAGQLFALNGLGYIHSAHARYEQSIECHGAALALARDTGHRLEEIEALNGLGIVHRRQEEYELAANCHGEALRLGRAAGYFTGELGALVHLGDLYRAQEHYTEALVCFEQVPELAVAVESQYWQFEGYLGLGRTYQAEGEFSRALRAYNRAVTLAQEIDQPAGEVRAIDGLAQVYRASGDVDQARSMWLHAIEIMTAQNTSSTDDVTVTDIRAHLSESI